jgi:SH3 domain-containing YSC84-like protein 1
VKKGESKMKSKGKLYLSVLAMAVVGVLLVPYSKALAAPDYQDAQALVEKARLTFSGFMRDPNYSWLRDHIQDAQGVLIFPQVLKAGFIVGGAGGTGVFVARDQISGDWTEPAFYTLGSVSFGLQAGAEAAEVVMLAMSQRAVDSLLSSSFKLGGEATIALGPVGAGAKAHADIPSVTGDFISFSKAKGLYAGLNLEGAVIAVRDSLNTAFYGRDVSPMDIIADMDVGHGRAAELLDALRCRC